MVRCANGWQDLMWVSSHSLFFTFSFILKEVCQFINFFFHRGGLNAVENYRVWGCHRDWETFARTGLNRQVLWILMCLVLEISAVWESSEVNVGKQHIFFCTSLWQKKVMNEEALAEQGSLNLGNLCSQDIWLFVLFRYRLWKLVVHFMDFTFTRRNFI